MAESLGFVRKLGIGASSPVTAQLEFLECDLAKRGTISPNSGIRGYLDEHYTATRNAEYTAGGTIRMEPRPDELSAILSYITGAAPSGGVYSPGESLTAFYATVDKGAKVFTYAGCVTAEATFSSQEGADSSMKLDWNIEAKTETQASAGTFPSLTLSTQPYFLHQDLALSIGGNAVQCSRFAFTIRYQLAIRHLNSQTRTLIVPIKRDVLWSIALPYDSTSAYASLYDLGVTGAAISATYTNGGLSLILACANAQWPTEPITMSGRGELFLPINGMSRRTATNNDAFTITLDATP